MRVSETLWPSLSCLPGHAVSLMALSSQKLKLIFRLCLKGDWNNAKGPLVFLGILAGIIILVIILAACGVFESKPKHNSSPALPSLKV